MISSSSMTRMELFISLCWETRRPDFRPAGDGSREPPRGAGLMGPGGRHRQWKPQRESCSLPDVAVARDRTTVLLDDAVRDREPQSRPLADRLRREERIVDPGELFCRNAGPRVRDFDDRGVGIHARDDRQPA